MSEIDLTHRMNQWRKGELSDSEMLRELIYAQYEVYNAIRNAETVKGEAMWDRIRPKPALSGSKGYALADDGHMED